MARERKLSTGRTAADEADVRATGKKPIWERSGMTKEEWQAGKARLKVEADAADDARESQIVRR
jgi:hypothetical protein